MHRSKSLTTALAVVVVCGFALAKQPKTKAQSSQPFVSAAASLPATNTGGAIPVCVDDTCQDVGGPGTTANAVTATLVGNGAEQKIPGAVMIGSCTPANPNVSAVRITVTTYANYAFLTLSLTVAGQEVPVANNLPLGAGNSKTASVNCAS